MKLHVFCADEHLVKMMTFKNVSVRDRVFKHLTESVLMSWKPASDKIGWLELSFQQAKTEACCQKPRPSLVYVCVKCETLCF